MLILAIDPDIDLSGIADYNSETKQYRSLNNIKFFDLLNLILQYDAIIIECGFLNKKSNFHYSSNQIIAQKIAYSVGENSAIQKLLVKFCEEKNKKFLMVRPRKGGSKINAKEFEFYTGLKKSNQDQRDAFMLLQRNIRLLS